MNKTTTNIFHRSLMCLIPAILFFVTTATAQTTWTEVANDDFESNWGTWNDGGSDCRRSINDASKANSGSYCVRLRDNTNTSVMTTDNLDLSSYTSAKIEFSFIASNMEVNEDFWLQYSTNGGSSFTTVEDWITGTDFSNNQRLNPSVEIAGSFTAATQIRFRCDATANNDWVYIDDVVISGGTTSGGDTEAPTIPGGLSASNITETSFDVSWNASTDNVGVIGYNIYLNSAYIGSTGTTSTPLSSLTADTPYTVHIEAYDAAGNTSAWSNVLNVTTATPSNNVVISDWDGTTASFTVSNGASYSTATNPSQGGINSSANSGLFVSTASQWDYLRLDLSGTTDFTAFPVYKLKVRADYTGGEILFKFEAGTGGNWVSRTGSPSVVGQWEEYTFDFTGETSDTFSRLIIALDRTNTTAGNNWYVDDLIKVGTGGGGDTEAPSTPSGLSSSNITSSSFDVSWTASTDNVGVTGYNVYLDGSPHSSPSSTSASFSGLTANTNYAVTVEAKDAAGNISALSSALIVQTAVSQGSPKTCQTTIDNWNGTTVTWADNGQMQTVANPDQSGVNTSSTSGLFTSSIGQYDNINTTFGQEIDLAANPVFRIKVLAPHHGTVVMKFENSDNSASTSRSLVPDKQGEWETLEFDFTGDANNGYVKMVIFFDLFYTQVGNLWYVDDVEQISASCVATADNYAPDVPANLAAIDAYETSAIISWDESIDDWKMDKYNIYVDNVLVKSTTGTKETLDGLTGGNSYAVEIQAQDAAGNTSAKSSSIQVNTTSANAHVIPADYNLRLGTQIIGPSYAFTSNELIETATAIREMGSNILKISTDVNSYDGVNGSYNSVKETVELNSSYQTVLNMDFSHYFLWVYGNGWFADGLTPAETTQAYNEAYDLTEYLLTQYNGTGKSFYLGHWEGDWHLYQDSYDDPWGPLVLQAVTGMITWLNTRQDAIDAAKAANPTSDVQVYHYTECNLVTKVFDGYEALITEVLPNVDIDLVSYSCYDATSYHNTYADVNTNLTAALDLIESYLPAKAGLPFNKRVFLGEYGYPNGRNDFENKGYKDPVNQQQQDEYSKNVMKVALEWGVPFALVWQMYDNEEKWTDGTGNGFWVINDDNEKQDLYFTHVDYYQEMEDQVEAYMAANSGATPSFSEFTTMAVNVIDGNISARMLTKEDGNFDEELEPSGPITIYPNPARDILNISDPGGNLLNASIYDLSGQRVLQIDLRSKSVSQLNIGNLDKGMYVLHLQTVDQQLISKKFVIEKD
ncbi:MAG: fibronectin type III domain-containing protein [Reichenbachiella sp.]|uniref:fibronectin type III domain-containing protein n=3 Tax=Reichenbachiella sp. TaxID=2184521 RepID=UPI003265D189